MKKILRSKSHRLPLRRKYTIIKKIKEHKRKLKRDLRRHPEKRRKPRADKGIPNSCPFKEDILVDMENLKRIKEKEQEARRAEMVEKRKQLREAKVMGNRAVTGNLENLVKSAEEQGAKFENSKENEYETEKEALTDNSAKAYIREFKKVVEAADVILEVLDARDPIGTRCSTVEQAVFNAGANKRLVLVLNKADLVPKENLTQWIKYLRNELPTVAFKASTQVQGKKLGRGRKKFFRSNQLEKTSKCLGADTLMELLGNYARNRGIKTAIRVGVVGLPNVGKSSIINSLKRSKACNIGAVPGVTKTMQEVALDSKIMLLDSPGIVMATGDASDTTVALRNATRIDSLDKARGPVETILKRTGKEYIVLQYNMTNFETTDEFLCIFAKRTGQLKKGGIPDVFGAAKRLIYDWNSGKIKYHTCPPESWTLTTHLDATIVATMAEEFSLDDANFTKKEKLDFDQLPIVNPSESVAIDSMGICEGNPDSNGNDDTMDCGESDSKDEEEQKQKVKVKVSKTTSKKDRLLKIEAVQKKNSPELLIPGNLRVNKLQKLKMKKIKKESSRRNRLSEKLAADMEVAFTGLADF